ncbi:MAG: prepilin peptidase [Patescibacteria group bacterium]|jgi:prepilin signal peptidase PulO-like enzyme (type II secretory pathway)
MTIYYEAIVFIFGLIIGSFLNCLIWRLYKNETLGGRSYCPQCRQAIAWYDNIPVLSFILLGGRCRHCQKKISWQYPLVELITAILFLLTWRTDVVSLNFSWLLLRDWLVVITMIVVFVYDYRWQLVPMTIVWPMSGVIFILNLILGIYWLNLLFFIVLSAGFFLIQYLITKKKGIGEGDIWLGVLLGVIFPQAGSLLLILLISYGLGALVGLTLMIGHKKGWKSSIALGPFLAVGAIITLIWGGQIIDWYGHFIY